MLHGRTLRPWIASTLLNTACNIDRLRAEFYVDFESSSETGSAGAPHDSSSTSSSSTTASSSTTTEDPADDSTSTTDASHTTPDDSSSTTTTSPPSICGDAVVDADEQCDDGNRDDLDACDNACASAWTIFVTSTKYTGDTNGLEGADNRCRNRAGNAGLPRWETYRALLSDSTTDAADRLYHAPGLYRLVNGLPVAHGWHALMTGPLENPVNVTELSTTAVVSVWTGSVYGATAVPGAEHCMNWTSESSLLYGHYGRSFDVDAAWLFSPSEANPSDCISNRSLYCIEQP